MTRDEWIRIKAVVSAALLEAPADRPAHLAAACGSDAHLRQEAEALLDAVDRASALYEHDALRVPGAGSSPDVWQAIVASAAGPSAVDALHLPPATREFLGTERYAVLRRVGVGGMGIVYAVEDRTRGQIVALKTLLRWNAAEIYRLKREFRSLADIAHANLVPLYELEVDAHQCFITMELVDGVTLVDYVRGGYDSAELLERVRQCLPQLVAGVQELHRCGTLHGDLKPSNVLVTRDGRVVILDFGLASGLAASRGPEQPVAGTPAYLSPEQWGEAPASEASDWYAVGATIYDALTGQPPFDGPLIDLVQRKVTADPVPPRVLDPEVPADLNAICMGLLQRDPARRWDGADVLLQLRGERGVPLATPPAAAPRTEFVGRDSYLARLESTWLTVKDGTHAAVYMHGPSGIGKTALLHHFIDQKARDPRLVLLQSRCYEHESMPYKGLDGVVDGLSRYLLALPPAEAVSLVASDAGTMARLFPVMQGLATSPEVAPEAAVADPLTLRNRAFAALRDTLDRVARRQPLIVAIDDFHWADAESRTALAALFQPPAPPGLLLLVCFRSEDIESKPFLRSLLDQRDQSTHALLLAPLSEPEVMRLVERLLPGSMGPEARDPRAIAREAGGHPLLVEELVRGVAQDLEVRRGLSLGDLLTRRLDRLPPGGRAFLDTLAVCGRPMAASRVSEACGLAGDERPLVAQLRAAHFLRSSRAPGQVEIYHDRIRETLAAVIDPEAARGIHERMAALVVRHGDDDPEALFEHYRASGRMVDAAGQAAVAAVRAATVLAFDRAALLFRHALELHPESAASAEWAAGLALALENGGRPVEAAEAYLDAARRARGGARIDWRRKAAELLLVGGRIDEGLCVSEDVLRTVGVRLARDAGRAVASLAIRRLQLRWRGLDFVDRRAAQVPAVDLLRIDACWSISVGLAMIDPLRAADFNVRQLLWALAVGDPQRVARALTLEAGFSVIVAVGGGRQRAAELFRRAEVLAQGLPDGTAKQYVTALGAVWAGIAAFLTGRWTEAHGLCRTAVTILRECTGVTWELNLAHSFWLYSLLYRGELREAASHLPGLLTAARERGNVYLELELGTRMSLVWLAADEPVAAERRADEAMARWAQRGFQRPHYHHLLTLVQTRLYRGRAREAWDLLDRHDEHLRQRLFTQVQHTRVELANCRARCALARAAEGDDGPRMRAAAAREATKIAREHMPWSQPFARLIGATVAFQEGDADAAEAGLRAAVDEFAAADMTLYATAARWRLAGVVVGDRGRALRDDAARWFASQRVRDPTALSRVLAPGFPD